jgi:glycosyltransferase involved in cell wall biosynthesis
MKPEVVKEVFVEKTSDNVHLNLWREDGIQSIQKNFVVFRDWVERTRQFVKHREYAAAAVYGEIAAVYANFDHCGLFFSPELEQLLVEVGREAIPEYSYSNCNYPPLETPQRVLHVATSVQSIGGLSKLLGRWIQQDSERSHSLALTRQPPKQEIPVTLRNVVSNRGGKIYRLNTTIGSVISWAKQLRKIASTVDVVILHVYNHDVIPILAFANKKDSPPIVYINHADHTFWLGVSISDVVANLRESGQRLSYHRRGIEIERNLLLPTIVDATSRKFSQIEAKRQLGLPKDSILLLSIARSPKYRTIDGITYADAHVPLLEKYQQTYLVVIGPDNSHDWSSAIQQTQGRIIVHPERADTSIFYQAADIYVDSFPFVSITSLLEAGSYGLPLVSRYPYLSDSSEILGADMPGLTGNLICVNNLQEYAAVLSSLVEDDKYRLKLGELTQKKIIETHIGTNWQHYLDEIYRTVRTLPRVTVPSSSKDQIFLGEPDVFIQRIHGLNFDMDQLVKYNLTVLPVRQRLREWYRLLKNSSFSNRSDRFSPIKYLMPEWLLNKVRQIF